MAHAQILRTGTQHSFHSSPHTISRSQTSMAFPHGPRASQLSGSTAYNSSSSLNSISSAMTYVGNGGTPSPGPVPGGGPVANSNIINQKADASRSLYQICMTLKQRLARVPGFEGYLEQLKQMARDTSEDGGPVETLWQLLRTGYPLLTIYNALQPEKSLQVEGRPNDSEAKRSKIAIHTFLKACVQDLKLDASDCFIINDLTGTDTTGFVKVTTIINHVLDLADRQNLLLEGQPYPEDDVMHAVLKLSYRDYVVRELVDTERKYVQDLENLHDLKKTLEQKGVIPGDYVHRIFLNITHMLDFQRRFLIRVETLNSMAAANQDWGSPFVAYESDFGIYQPFIANQRKAAQLANQVFDKIQGADHPVACDFNTLDGFLLKPMQRLVKYPLLLKDLLKKSENEATKADLVVGIAAAERVLQRANEAVNQDLLDEALEDLTSRVDDWKNHQMDHFGKLLLHGVYTVVTGKSDQEKDVSDYEIYLFQNILLCCKEINGKEKKEKKDKTKSIGPKLRNKNAKLQLKGRIFMSNVTDVVSISKTGSYTVQINWKGDPGVENFVIKFTNEETLRKWATGLEQQRKQNMPQTRPLPDQPPPNFAWMQSQTEMMENPYKQEDEDEDDSSLYGQTPTPTSYGAAGHMAGSMPRHASNTNLRQRLGTTENAHSLAGAGRQPARFAVAQAPSPLSLQTGPTAQPQHSPLPRGGDSYFSPVAESPASSRTSGTSGVFTSGYPFPRHVTPQGAAGWATGEETNRYTAPAMARAPSRDGPSPVNGYGTVNGRNPRGPSLPVMPRDNAQMQQQQRNRSYSTPDIKGQTNGRIPSGQTVPAVPGIPAHLSHARHESAASRSNAVSPANDLPLRTGTQSPGAQRARANQYPSQPTYHRQGTPSNGAVTLPPAGLAPLAHADPVRSISPGLDSALLAPMGQNPLASPSNDMALPTQLKVKVNYEATNYVTLVIPFNYSYQSLVSRIDNKLQRFTSNTIAKGNLTLQYRDEDGDFVTIESDEDIQIAISEWHEGVQNQYTTLPGAGEIELFLRGEVT